MSQEIILKPEMVESDEIAILHLNDNEIICRTKHYDERFYKVMRAYKLCWNSEFKYWEKTVIRELAIDRIVELGIALLLKGFMLHLANSELADKIKSNDYKPEPTRIISICDISNYENYLTVSWLREDLYSCIRQNLYGSKYLKKHKCIVVPIYFYDEIYAFAEDYEFLITNEAHERIEQGKKDICVLFNIEKPPSKKNTVFHEPSLLMPPRAEIDTTLKDESI